MRVVFLGTPEFAAIPLAALARDGRYELVGVVTQPDRPAGRGRAPEPPPVKRKVAELSLDIPVLQPETLRDSAAVETLAALRPDIGVVAAYGEILRKSVLAIPPLGYLNIHPSLLPRHRGPAPVVGAILSGDDATGVTIMLLESKMDAGPILAQRRVPLPPGARADALTTELFELGAEMLVETLAGYAAGAIAPVPQDDEQATYTKMLQKSDGIVDWGAPAVQIERMARAYHPWPGAQTTWRGQPLKIVAARPHPGWAGPEPPGTLLDRSDGAWVAAGAGALELLVVQPAGKREMPADAWRRGIQRVVPGERLGV